MVIGGIGGLINWINNLATALDYGETVSFVVQLVLFQIFIPINGLIPGICWFVFLFIAGLPFYGIYRLFKND